MMASDWPVYAQEAAARLFAHALPSRHHQHHHQQAHPSQPHQLTMINAEWWPMAGQATQNNHDLYNPHTPANSWADWIPCFERDVNENDISEPILVGPETPTEEVCTPNLACPL